MVVFRESAGQSLCAGAASGSTGDVFRQGGKSGLRRARRQVTPGGRKPTESATENIPPTPNASSNVPPWDLRDGHSGGKGEMVSVKAHRIGGNVGGRVNPAWSKTK